MRRLALQNGQESCVGMVNLSELPARIRALHYANGPSAGVLILPGLRWNASPSRPQGPGQRYFPLRGRAPRCVDSERKRWREVKASLKAREAQREPRRKLTGPAKERVSSKTLDLDIPT